MQASSRPQSKIISIDQADLPAAKCDECGAKIYPLSLLEPHLLRHRRHKRWLNAELRKLRFTFSHMRNFA